MVNSHIAATEIDAAPDMAEEELFEVQLTDEAVYAYSDIPSQDISSRIGFLLDFLAAHPQYGEEYDPYYETARPPIACRVFFCGKYGVYYHINESERLITVLAIEDQRRNPLNRLKLIGTD